MFVGGVSAVSLSWSSGEGGFIASPLFGSFSSSSSSSSYGCWKLRRRGINNNGLVVRGSAERSNGVSSTKSTVAFQPFEELKKEDFLVPISPQHSLARQGYSGDCEAAINEQIKWEFLFFFFFF